MKYVRTITATSFIILTLVLGTASFAHAQDALNRGPAPTNIPGTSDTNGLVNCGNGDQDAKAGDACDFIDLITLIQNILNLMFALAGFVAAAMFMYAGFLMITAMGDVSKITKAKAVMRRLVVGFLIMFMSFLIIQQLLQRLALSTEAQKVIGKFIDVPASNSSGNTTSGSRN